jgi:hypothetical protein
MCNDGNYNNFFSCGWSSDATGNNYTTTGTWTWWFVNCPNCGCSFDGTFKFCPYCGYDMSIVPEISNQEVIDKLDKILKEVNELKAKLIEKDG